MSDKKDFITFTASKTFEDDKMYLTFASSAHEFTEKYLIEWDNFKNSSLIKEIPPEVLIKNPFVKELVEALENLIEDIKTPNSLGLAKPVNPEWVNFNKAQKALAEFEGE